MTVHCNRAVTLIAIALVTVLAYGWVIVPAAGAADPEWGASYAILANPKASGPWMPGETRTATVRVTNTGTNPWNATGEQPVRLGVHFGTNSDAPHDGWVTDQRIPLNGNVTPGSSIDLTFAVTAPTQPGTYYLHYRMVKEGVTWFDSLLKDPDHKVKEPFEYDITAFTRINNPMNTDTDASNFYNITIKNTGSQTWNHIGDQRVRLGVYWMLNPDNDSGDGWFADQRKELTTDVPPGGEITLNNVEIKNPSEPGNYWRRMRMVKEGVTWFPMPTGADLNFERVNFTITQAPPQFSYDLTSFNVSGTLPSTTGAVYMASMTIRNTGTQTWNASGDNPVRVGIHYVGAPDTNDPHLRWATDLRISLPNNVPAGGEVTISGVLITTPSIAGTFYRHVRLVKEGVTWFPMDDGASVQHVISPGTPVPQLAYDYVTSSSPDFNTNAGQSYTATIVIRNTGTEIWRHDGDQKVRVGVHFVKDPDSDDLNVPWATDDRFELDRDVPPYSVDQTNGEITLTSKVIHNPSTEGNYHMHIRLVKEGIAWFPQDPDAVWARQIGPNPTPPPSEFGYEVTSFTGMPTTFEGGATWTAHITVKNTGTQTWNAGGEQPVHLGIHFVGWPDTANLERWVTDQRFDLAHDVPSYITDWVNGQISFDVQVTNPTVPGDYYLHVRMVKEGVTWFPMALNPPASTPVTVVAGPPGIDPQWRASYESFPPTIWYSGQTSSYTVKVTNTGTQPWSASDPNRVRLGVHFGTSSDAWHDGWAQDYRFELPHDVAVGESVDIPVEVTAPTQGSWVLRHRMVKEGVTWFPDIQKIPVTVNTEPYRASYSFDSGYPPVIWHVGETKTYNINITNAGSEAWNRSGPNPVHLGVHFGNDSDDCGPSNTSWATDQRLELPDNVPVSGTTGSFQITVTAPTTPGSYVLRHRMVKEGVTWFQDIYRTVVVVNP